MNQPGVKMRVTAADQAGALLARVADGDRQAFETLYHASSSALLGICVRVLVDRAEAEDVLQEIFVTIWKKADQFDPAVAPGMNWLGSLARRRAIDRLRARTPVTAQGTKADLAWIADDDEATPEHQAAATAQREQLDDCLDELEPRRRALIRTAFFDGATYEDLANRSGSPLGSIKSWIRRGLLQLKACLER